MKLDKFQKDLEELINKHSVDNYCDTPDFILAEELTQTVLNFRSLMKKNMKWHNWPDLETKLKESLKS